MLIFTLKRFYRDRLTAVIISIAVVISVTLVVMVPTLFAAIEQLALNQTISGLADRKSGITVLSYNLVVTDSVLEGADKKVRSAIIGYIGEVYQSHERYVVVDPYLAWLPDKGFDVSGNRILTSRVFRGSIRYLTGLEDNVNFVEGRMANSSIYWTNNGLTVEAVISPTTARKYDLESGDFISVAPTLESSHHLIIRIVGIIEASDPTGPNWSPHANLFLDPYEVADTFVEGYSEAFGFPSVEFDNELPPLPLFVNENVLADAINDTFPGSLADSVWFLDVNVDLLKEWSLSESTGRLNDFRAIIRRTIPGAEVTTLVEGVLSDFERENFLSRIPLQILVVILSFSLLLFVSIVVMYRVYAAERDIVVFRSRGASISILAKLCLIEGVIICVVAVITAPVLSVISVSLFGKLPFFASITGGELLPVKVHKDLFLWALGVGFLLLVIYLFVYVLLGRTRSLVQKLNSSRPSQTLFFHSGYIDIGFLVVVGLIGWELYERGQITSSGLLSVIGGNELLLVAPVLLIIGVAFIFLRLSDLISRIFSSRLTNLSNLIVWISILSSVGVALFTRSKQWDFTIDFAPIILPIAFGLTYIFVYQRKQWGIRSLGILFQLVLLTGLFYFRPDEPFFMLPYVGLCFVLIVQIIPVAGRLLVFIAPVWLSFGLERIVRTPFEYTWLIILFIVVSAAGVFSTTVGGSLEVNQSDRIKYEVGSDIRVVDVDGYSPQGHRQFKERYKSIIGIESVALALRLRAAAGPANIEMLAVESFEFPDISWYRDDFSSRSLDSLMLALRSHNSTKKIVIPEEAVSISVSLRPDKEYQNISMWIVMQDGRGVIRPVSLGNLGPSEWHSIAGRLPDGLTNPVSIEAVQLFEPGQGSVLTAGTVEINEIVATTRSGKEHLLEDFEGFSRWTPIVTSVLRPDNIEIKLSSGSLGGKVAVFSFGEENIRGVRGFYNSTTGGPVPVLLSSSFVAQTGIQNGDMLVLEIADRKIPVILVDTVDYFPTMDPYDEGFVIADIDSILWHLNIVGHQSQLYPNEVFLSEVSTDQKAVRQDLSMMTLLSGQVLDKSEQLSTLETDPLLSAGWRSFGLVSVGLVVLLISLSYFMYALFFLNKRRSEVGYMKSIGFSRGQMLGLLSLDHILISCIGLGIGSAAGFYVSELIVSSIVSFGDGQYAAPPFRIIVDWVLLIPAYFGLSIAFFGSLILLERSVNRLDLQAVARVE